MQVTPRLAEWSIHDPQPFAHTASNLEVGIADGLRDPVRSGRGWVVPCVPVRWAAPAAGTRCRKQLAPTPVILDIARRSEVILEEGHPIRFARLEITTKSGDRYVREADDYVFPREAWLDWLTGHADGQFPRDRQVRLEHLVANLEAVGNVSDLMACVSASRRR
jgi:hypothetical protein